MAIPDKANMFKYGVVYEIAFDNSVDPAYRIKEHMFVTIAFETKDPEAAKRINEVVKYLWPESSTSSTFTNNLDTILRLNSLVSTVPMKGRLVSRAPAVPSLFRYLERPINRALWS